VAKVKLTNEDGDLTEGEKASLVNNSLNSLFKMVEVIIGGCHTNAEVGTGHAMKAYIDKLLFHEVGELQSKAQSELFYPDTGFLFDSCTSANAGHYARQLRTALSKPVTLCGPLAVDSCCIKQPLLPNIPIDMRFYPNSDEFLVLADATTGKTYSVTIIDLAFVVQYIKPCDQVINKHESDLANKNALYYMYQSIYRPSSIPLGSQTYIAEMLFGSSAVVPDKVVVGFMPTDRYLGKFTKNPFKFDHHNVESVTLRINSQILNGLEYKPRYEDQLNKDSELIGVQGEFAREYLSLFPETNPSFGSVIEMKHYPAGYCLYMFSVTRGFHGNSIAKKKEGTCQLSIRFSKATAAGLTCICYGLSTSIMEVDKHRKVKIVSPQ